jgi:hypothetical protein
VVPQVLSRWRPQVSSPAETVQAQAQRQAALLASEALSRQLAEEQAKLAALGHVRKMSPLLKPCMNALSVANVTLVEVIVLWLGRRMTHCGSSWRAWRCKRCRCRPTQR